MGKVGVEFQNGNGGVGDWIGQGYWEELSPRAAGLPLFRTERGRMGHPSFMCDLELRSEWVGHPSSYYLVLSIMATLPYSSMGMATSGALLPVMKSPEAMEKPPW